MRSGHVKGARKEGDGACADTRRGAAAARLLVRGPARLDPRTLSLDSSSRSAPSQYRQSTPAVGDMMVAKASSASWSAEAPP